MKQAKTGFMGTPAYMAPYVCCVDDTHCRQSLTSNRVVVVHAQGDDEGITSALL